jgi:hypothetical protein
VIQMATGKNQMCCVRSGEQPGVYLPYLAYDRIAKSSKIRSQVTLLPAEGDTAWSARERGASGVSCQAATRPSATLQDSRLSTPIPSKPTTFACLSRAYGPYRH